MNVFPDRPSLITLEAHPRSHDSAVIAILGYRLPYELHLTDSHLPQFPHLTDTRSNGAQIGLSDVVSIASYLVAQYDKEQRTISYRNGTKEATEIQRWVGLLSERSKTPAQAQAQRKAQTRRSSPSDDAQARESRVQVVRKMLHLYLLMEGRLQDRKSGGYLVGGKCTLADLIHFPAVAAAGSLDIDLERFTELTAWYNRLCGVGAVRRGMKAVNVLLCYLRHLWETCLHL